MTGRSAQTRKAALVLLALFVSLAPAATLVAAGRIGGGGEAEPARDRAAGRTDFHPVAGNFRPDSTSLADCESGASGCLEQAFGNLTYREGPKAALGRFDRAIASDPAVEAGCHRIAHMIGSAALARYDGDLGRAFAEGSPSCWSGYYHGILERALLDAKGPDALAEAARTLCSDSGIRRTPFTAYNCIHGLGHGLMITSGLELPVALEICEQLATEWDQMTCDGGVFMENFNTSYGVESRYLRDDDPVYPCNAVAKRHKLYCYLQVTDRILRITSYDWAETAEMCAGLEASWVATCFQSYGRSASGISRIDNRRLLELCAVARSAGGEVDCVYGAARDIVAQEAVATRAADFCTTAPGEARGRCFNGIGTILSDLLGRDPDRLATACREITRDFIAQCTLARGD